MIYTYDDYLNLKINIISDEKNLSIDIPGHYHQRFSKVNGFMGRWGNKISDDPDMCPVGPEILGIEIGTICNGVNNIPCKSCYKSLTPKGKFMTVDIMNSILSKIQKSVSQIALGIGNIDSNPHIWQICELKYEIVPNITINGDRANKDIFDNLAKYMGAVAVSHYDDDLCFNAVNELSSRGMKQVNIHKLLSEDTINSCFDLVNKVRTDSRLENLNALVFLLMKPKGNRNCSTVLKDMDKFKQLLNHCIYNKVPIGFDSCSANLVSKHSMVDFKQIIEPYESFLFSLYINVDGIISPCSFAENIEKEIDLLKCNDFIRDVWYSETAYNWRLKLLSDERNCPLFK